MLPFHIGNDICQISRIRTILASGRGAQFARRVLTDREREQMGARGLLAGLERSESPPESELHLSAVFLAGR